MKEKLKLYGAVFILILFVPCLLTIYFQGEGLLSGFAGRELSDTEKKVIRLVSEEMPGSYETEALKAQAVIDLFHRAGNLVSIPVTQPYRIYIYRQTLG